MRRPLTRRPLALAAAVLMGLALALVVGPASAHDQVVGSDPAAGSQVAALPAEVTMTFSGVLLDEPGATEVIVTDAACNDLTSGDPVLNGTRLTQQLSGTASGNVTVTYRVVSSDGHPVSDQFSFDVGSGATSGADAGATSASAATPACNDGALPGQTPQDNAVGIVWIVVGVLVVALGGALVAVLIARARRPRED